MPKNNASHKDSKQPAGAPPHRLVDFATLPDDMQDILMSFFGEFDQDVPAQLPTKLIKLSRFPDAKLADGVHDERGVDYAKDMIGQAVPPIIVYGDTWLDGRHRVWAAKNERKAQIEAIDIAQYLPRQAMQVIEPIAKLKKDVTATPAFQTWFADSKMVDRHGDPLVVYHGCKGQLGSVTGDLFWVTPSKDLACSLNGRKLKANPLYAKVERFFDPSNEQHVAKIADRFDEAFRGTTFSDWRRRIREHWKVWDDPKALDAVKRAGFDAILSEEDGHRTIALVGGVAGRVKSADRNFGTFDAGDPDVTDARAKAEKAANAARRAQSHLASLPSRKAVPHA